MSTRTVTVGLPDGETYTFEHVTQLHVGEEVEIHCATWSDALLKDLEYRAGIFAPGQWAYVLEGEWG